MSELLDDDYYEEEDPRFEELRQLAEVVPAKVEKPKAFKKPQAVRTVKPALSIVPKSGEKSLEGSGESFPTLAPKFLWRPVLMANKLNFVAGNGGTGKSLLSHYVTSRLTTGRPLAGMPEAVDPMNVLYFPGEDSIPETVKPNLIAAGADVSRVFFWEALGGADTGRFDFSFANKKHVEAFLVKIKRYGVRFLVFDPISAYTGVDPTDGAKVRTVLMAVQRLCEAEKLTMFGILHQNKDTKTVDPKGRVAGVKEWVDVPRSTFGFYNDPNDTGGQEKLLLPIKYNLLSPENRHGYRCRIQHTNVTVYDEDLGRTKVMTFPLLEVDDTPDYTNPRDLMKLEFARDQATAPPGQISLRPQLAAIRDLMLKATRPYTTEDLLAATKMASTDSLKQAMSTLRNYKPEALVASLPGVGRKVGYVDDSANWERIGECPACNGGKKPNCRVCGGLGVTYRRK